MQEIDTSLRLLNGRNKTVKEEKMKTKKKQGEKERETDKHRKRTDENKGKLRRKHGGFGVDWVTKGTKEPTTTKKENSC
jgi:hypothetical protein